MTRPPWLERPAEALRWIAYHSPLWLTPFVGMVDRTDLEYLRSSVERDLAWLDVIIKGLSETDKVGREKLMQVRAALGAIAGLGPTTEAAVLPGKLLKPIRYEWDVQRGWTDYGAIRLALLASLPPSAWHAALAELRNMSAVVLPNNRPTWEKHVVEVDKLIGEVDAGRGGAERVPHELQALWREVDFGRNQQRARVAKQTTTARIIWTLVVTTTIVITCYLSIWARSDEFFSVVPWFVTLCGLLGGAVSALRSLSFTDLPERASLEVEAVKLRLRPYVGAMSAIVVYMIGRSALVFEIVERVSETAAGTAPVQIKVGEGHVAWAYYALAFVAGFSERLFLGLLKSIEDRVSPSERGKNGGGGAAGNDDKKVP